MEAKKESLHRCRCGDPHPIVAKTKAGIFIVACNSCPTHVYGDTEDEARKNWNAEVSRV